MIVITPYQSEWPERFAALGKNLRHALGNLALRIDHIGSTAVPGLAAKDRIDVQITVAALAPPIHEALECGGFKRVEHIAADHVPPGFPTESAEWAKWIYNPAADEWAANIHVRVAGRANQRYALLFRDYLRAHPVIAAAYGQVKQALIAQGCDHSDAYYAVKDPVCDLLIGGGEVWAAATNWNAGPSDA